MRPALYDQLFATFAFVLGSCIGSFLNVCIYRMPRDLSVNEPKRSFCPNCKYQIPWYHNLPLITWLVLRGKCANCGTRIAFRYFGVELLTGLLFLAVWLKVWPNLWILALPYWILVSLFVVATFIDFQFFIIPDEITWGGAVAGIILSLAIPLMMGVPADQGFGANLISAGWSIVGAALGYAVLRGVVELGKLAFGKKKIAFDKSTHFTWTRDNDDADLVVGEDKDRWSEFFARETDRMLMECDWAEIEGERFEKVTLEFHYNRVQAGEKTWELIKLDAIRGELKEIIIPREAMGLGDVKFIAAIGAFLGWKSVLFTVMAASSVGAVVGLVTIAVGRREWSAKIPFGPYLAMGAMLWLFKGPEILAWYWNMVRPPLD